MVMKVHVDSRRSMTGDDGISPSCSNRLAGAKASTPATRACARACSAAPYGVSMAPARTAGISREPAHGELGIEADDPHADEGGRHQERQPCSGRPGVGAPPTQVRGEERDEGGATDEGEDRAADDPPQGEGLAVGERQPGKSPEQRQRCRRQDRRTHHGRQRAGALGCPPGRLLGPGVDQGHQRCSAHVEHGHDAALQHGVPEEDPDDGEAHQHHGHHTGREALRAAGAVPDEGQRDEPHADGRPHLTSDRRQRMAPVSMSPGISASGSVSCPGAGWGSRWRPGRRSRRTGARGRRSMNAAPGLAGA